MKLLIFCSLIAFASCDRYHLQSVFDELFAKCEIKSSQPSFDLLKTTNRECVKEKLNLEISNPELSFGSAIVAIYSGAFLCKPDLSDYLDQLFDNTLKTLKSDENAENTECYKLAVLKYDPTSRLIQSFDKNSVTKPNCEEIAENSREEALKGLTAAFGGFHESTYGPDGEENKAIMYKLLILANGNLSDQLVELAKNHYKEDFKRKSRLRIENILREIDA